MVQFIPSPVLLAWLICLCSAQVPPSTQTICSGTYTWNQRQNVSSPLTMVFTPLVPGEWSLDVHFTFDGVELTYSGHARGSLKHGSLRARIQNPGQNRDFFFRGRWVNGRFHGIHGEQLKDGREEQTGTLSFGPTINQ